VSEAPATDSVYLKCLSLPTLAFCQGECGVGNGVRRQIGLAAGGIPARLTLESMLCRWEKELVK
jgi:hypothetical protein